MTRIEPVIGKYIYLTVQDVEYRVYFEESGQGIPRCQHTAGSDGRQWRHLLNDTEVTSMYRVMVFDLLIMAKAYPPSRLSGGRKNSSCTRAFFLISTSSSLTLLVLKGPFI